MWTSKPLPAVLPCFCLWFVCWFWAVSSNVFVYRCIFNGICLHFFPLGLNAALTSVCVPLCASCPCCPSYSHVWVCFSCRVRCSRRLVEADDSRTHRTSASNDHPSWREDASQRPWLLSGQPCGQWVYLVVKLLKKSLRAILLSRGRKYVFILSCLTINNPI